MAFPIADGQVSLSGTYIPEIWSGKLLEKFYGATVFAQISNTDYEGEISAFGDKVQIRTIPDMTVFEYTKGMTLPTQTPSAANIELLIDKGFAYNVGISDVDKKQADIPFMDKWGEDASEQMKIKIDSSILGAIHASADSGNSGLTAGKISGNVDLGVTGTPLELTKSNVLDKIVECGQVLGEQDVPESGRWAVIPRWLASRIKLSDLKDASMTGDGKSVLRNGRIGSVDGLTLYSSNSIAHVTDGTVEAFHAMVGHRSALTFASQLVENEIIPNPNDFGKLMRGLQVFGYKVVKPVSLVDLYCYAG